MEQKKSRSGFLAAISSLSGSQKTMAVYTRAVPTTEDLQFLRGSHYSVQSVVIVGCGVAVVTRISITILYRKKSIKKRILKFYGGVLIMKSN